MHEETSARAALMLRQKGFRAFALEGGFEGWKEAGYPLETKEVELTSIGDEICSVCGVPLKDHLAGHAH